jgi:ADP-ribose pyrophosphatase YjhB (NUDIX family)
VRGAVFEQNRLLVVREREDGGWTLPGGWAEVGQSAAESVEREVREESGYVVKAKKLLACWDRNKHPHPAIPFHAYKLVFRCELISGIATPGTETAEVGFFAEDQVPALSVLRTLPEQIQFVFHHVRNPDAPTAFELNAPAVRFSHGQNCDRARCWCGLNAAQKSPLFDPRDGCDPELWLVCVAKRIPDDR